MDFKLMQPGQENLAIEIVTTVFDEFIAPGYAQEGVAEFYKFANIEHLAKRSRTNHFTILAQEGETYLGLIEIRDSCHVSMFFVRKQFQRQGVGKALFKEALKMLKNGQGGPHALTVNSSPGSVNAYKKMGFIAETGEQCVNGIRFVPMKLPMIP